MPLPLSSASRQICPNDIKQFLQTICNVPHAVVKLDGQPRGFPTAINIGGDLDILTIPRYVQQMKDRVHQYFRNFSGVYSLRTIEGENDQWKLRLEQNNRLVSGGR